MNLRVSLDIDDVCSQTMKRALVLIAEDGGPKLDLEQITTWGFAGIVGIDESKVPALFTRIWGNGQWKAIEPCDPDMVEQVNRLSTFADVSIVTSAGAGQVEGKLHWLEYQWKAAQSQFQLPLTVVPYGMTKEHLHYNTFIDDRPETIEGARRLNKHVILRDRPWNRSVNNGVPRVYSLKEAVDLLAKLAGEEH